jgi:hypothetical protein
MTRSKLLFILLCALLGGLATSSAVSAQAQITNTSLALDVTVGFDNLRKGQGWTPVQITVANTGSAIEGHLTIYTGNPNSRTLRYTTPISLPTQSNRRIFLNAYLGSNTINVEITDANGELVVRERLSRVRSIDNEALLYGVVSPNPDALEILTRVTEGRPSAAVAFLRLTDLPADTVAWRMLDVLILSDVDTNELSAGQREALRGWVDTGGQLVVAGGANWQKTTTALADLLPVEPTGIESAADLPSLAQTMGHPFRDAGPYTVTTSRLRDGELLLREGNLPLLARRPQGLGNVFFLALDPQFAPLDAWAGREALWGQVAQYIPLRPVWGDDFRNGDALVYAVEVFPNLTLPSAVGLFAFLCIYVIVIGPLNYALLALWNKREWGWVSVPAIVVVFSVLAYAIGLATLGNRAMINQMAMVHGQMGASGGQAHTAVALYSPSRSNYTLQFPATTQIRPLTQSFTFGNREMTVARDSQITVQSNLVDVGQVLTYAASAHVPLPTVRGEVVMQEEQSGQLSLEITLNNQSELAFENGLILVDRHAIGVPRLAPGETAVHNYTIPAGPSANLVREAALGFHTADSAVSASYNEPLEAYYNHLLGSSTTYYYYYSAGDDPIAYSRYQFLSGLRDYSSTSSGNFPRGQVTFMAWTNAPALDIELISQRATSEATTLYLLEIPFRP